MRIHPDPLTCSTGPIFPSSTTPRPTSTGPEGFIRSGIWFEDGNVILVAGSAAFKVHRGQLERHSDVFKDLFLVGRPHEHGVREIGRDRGEKASEDESKGVDGCPTVELYDCPSDVYHLLIALYDGFYFPKHRSRNFSSLSSVFRLSTKYFIEHLRIQCLARLSHDWPTTLAAWDKRESAAIDAYGRYSPRTTYPHPILAINLALELGLPEVLSSAFYDLSRYGPSKILSGARAPVPVFAAADPCSLRSGEGQKDEPMIHLSHDSLVRALRGRELAQLYISTFLTRALEHRPSASCQHATRSTSTSTSTSTSSSSSTSSLSSHAKKSASGMTATPTIPSAHCTESFYFIHLNVLRSVGGIAYGRDADPLFTLIQAAEMLERKDFSDGQHTRGLRMCGACRREWRGEVGRAREEVWGLIPVWFGLKEGPRAGGAAYSKEGVEDSVVEEDVEREEEYILAVEEMMAVEEDEDNDVDLDDGLQES